MKQRFKHISSFLAILIAVTVVFSSCGANPSNETTAQPTTNVQTTVSNGGNEEASTVNEPTSQPTTNAQTTVSKFKYEDVPAYSGKPFYEVNGNVPYFVKGDNYSTFSSVIYEAGLKAAVLKDGDFFSFEYYGGLDNLDRCTVCTASIGKDLMPTESRGDISEVHPTGWEGNKYRIKNRCHIIGFQLAGENDNEKNLFTGTRYLNVEGMLPFENTVADYVEKTGNHVLYRVTPIFVGTELMARGVLMEAYSVEDSGKGVRFCVYCYNVQEGYSIDYTTGIETYLKENKTTNNTSSEKAKYVLNTKSKKVHLPSCSALEKTAEKNKKEYNGNKEDLYAEGYSPCGYCNP